MGDSNLEAMIERYHEAAATFIQGDPEPYKALWSQRDDVSVANPFHPVATGWDEAAATMDRAASNWREGEIVGFESKAQVVEADLAFILEIERFRAKIGGSSSMSAVELRTTTVFRREDGEWKVVHRHADPITTPRPAESVVQQ